MPALLVSKHWHFYFIIKKGRKNNASYAVGQSFWTGHRDNQGGFPTARSKLPARLISTRHPILRITTLSARCESLLWREPFRVSDIVWEPPCGPPHGLVEKDTFPPLSFCPLSSLLVSLPYLSLLLLPTTISFFLSL